MKINYEGNCEGVSINLLQSLVLLYLPCEKFSDTDDHGELFCRFKIDENSLCDCTVRFSLDGRCEEHSVFGEDISKYIAVTIPPRLFLCRCIVLCAKKMFGFVPEWGVLTGIRPAKIAARYLEGGFTYEETKKLLSSFYLLTEQKADLCLRTALCEREVVNQKNKREFSIYISIPFCPSKCKYCSFVSCATQRLFSLIPDYLIRLKKDMENYSNLARELGLSLSSVYIGGGTPSILTDEQIAFLLSSVCENFDVENAYEFSFEAGRPDTVTYEKLLAAKQFGVDRISINTQTTNDAILSLVGRKHTFADYVNALEIANKVGFKTVNTDLIAGLPSESVDSFRKSVDDVISLSPQNITVHSFSLKVASEFKIKGYLPSGAYSEDAVNMLKYADEKLTSAKYRPYYIYKQKNTVSNLENIGYSKPGHEGVYNIYMMDEYHTVLSFGAGAVTKLVSKDRERIERIFHPKYPYEYLDRGIQGDCGIEIIREFYNNKF